MSDESEWEVLVEVWKITEMRDGAVYKTELVGEEWVPMESRWGDHRTGLIYASLNRHVNPRRKVIKP